MTMELLRRPGCSSNTKYSLVILKQVWERSRKFDGGGEGKCRGRRQENTFHIYSVQFLKRLYEHVSCPSASACTLPLQPTASLEYSPGSSLQNISGTDKQKDRERRIRGRE